MYKVIVDGLEIGITEKVPTLTCNQYPFNGCNKVTNIQWEHLKVISESQNLSTSNWAVDQLMKQAMNAREYYHNLKEGDIDNFEFSQKTMFKMQVVEEESVIECSECFIKDVNYVVNDLEITIEFYHAQAL
jgi:hypothetical protein